MPLTLPSDLIAEKNKIYATGAFLELIELSVSELSETYRIVDNNEDITWDGETWSKFSFRVGDFKEGSQGETQGIQIQVSNVNRTLENYIKGTSNGLVGDTLTYRLVHSDFPAVGAAITVIFDIISVEFDLVWAYFNLGAENFFFKRFPLNTYSRKICRYSSQDKFRGNQCGYSGNNYYCDYTFQRCIYLGNQQRFGGQPGMPNGQFDEDIATWLINQEWIEEFENTDGYDMAWSPGTFIGPGTVLDPNTLVSEAGSPAGWDSLCFKVTYASSGVSNPYGYLRKDGFYSDEATITFDMYVTALWPEGEYLKVIEIQDSQGNGLVELSLVSESYHSGGNFRPTLKVIDSGDNEVLNQFATYYDIETLISVSIVYDKANNNIILTLNSDELYNGYAKLTAINDFKFGVVECSNWGVDKCVGGTATASHYVSSYTPSKAFDNQFPNNYWCDLVYGGDPGWIKYEFVSAQVIKRIRIFTNLVAGCPKSFVVKGSNNGSSWTTLKTVAVSGLSQPGTSSISVDFFMLDNDTAYKYIMLDISTKYTPENYVYVDEIEMFAEDQSQTYDFEVIFDNFIIDKSPLSSSSQSSYSVSESSFSLSSQSLDSASSLSSVSSSSDPSVSSSSESSESSDSSISSASLTSDSSSSDSSVSSESSNSSESSISSSSSSSESV